MSKLIVHMWHTSCGECGYGGGSWADSPALEGKPVLVPESKECPNCGTTFDEVESVYGQVL